MYDFPPDPRVLHGWPLFLGHLALLVCGLAVIGYLSRPKREPTLWDSVLFLVIGTAMVVVFTATNSDTGQPYAHGSFIVVTLAIVLLATVMNWWRLDRADRAKEMLYSALGLVVGFLLLACLLMPSGTHPRGYARRRQCKLNLKQIGLALHNYHDTHDGFPTYRAGHPPHSWRVSLLPYVDHTPLYMEYDFEEEWNGGSNVDIAKLKMLVYECPSDPFHSSEEKFPFTAYAAMVGEDAIWGEETTKTFREITDGTSNTLLVVEACGQRIPWCEPRDILLSQTELAINAPGHQLGRSEGAFSSFHTGGFQVLMADGSVRFISENLGKEVLQGLTTASGQEMLTDF